MKLFGREREMLRVKKAKSSRAVYVDTDIQRVEIKLLVEDGQFLTLDMDLDTVHTMVIELSNAYSACRPGLSRGSYQSQWQGMED